MMKYAVFMLLSFCVMGAKAQDNSEAPFRGYLFNQENDVYMRINFYEQDVVIGWQEMFGQLPGFLAKSGSNLCWIITSAEVNGNRADLELVNDYGSEDLTATLTQINDSVFELKQGSGSALKIVQNGKWQKLPGTLTLKKKK